MCMQLRIVSLSAPKKSQKDVDITGGLDDEDLEPQEDLPVTKGPKTWRDIKLKNVKSSNIKAVGHSGPSLNSKKSFMVVEFLGHGGPSRIYVYSAVPYTTFLKIMMSSSKGKALNRLIKIPGPSVFPYERVK